MADGDLQARAAAATRLLEQRRDRRGEEYYQSLDAVRSLVAEDPGVTRREIELECHLSKGMAKNRLRELIDVGDVRRERDGRQFRYYPARNGTDG